MGRVGGFLNKQDTPVKTPLNKRGKCRRFLPIKHYATLPEEPEESETILTVTPRNMVLANIKPVHCKSVLRFSSPAFTENPRSKAVSPAAPAQKKYGHQVPPAGHSAIQVTPDAEAFRCVEMQIKEEEQNVAVTPESITPSSMELDTTFSLEEEEEEEEEDCQSSTASSSLPSPEIFRKESYVTETLTFPMKEELLGLHPHTKNSTLLDVSHAECIHMHHPPNLSTIIGIYTSGEKLSFCPRRLQQQFLPPSPKVTPPIAICRKGTEADTKIHADSLKSDKTFKWKTPQKIANRRPILFKKKVCFKSPIIAEIFEAKHVPATKLTLNNSGELVQTPSHAEQMKPNTDLLRRGGNSSNEEALQLQVRLKRPIKSKLETAKFFDFIEDSDRDAFFQGMRERCRKLKSAPLFPLTADKNTEFDVP